jgi:diguanylate cyclase (GGDEF)-like protein
MPDLRQDRPASAAARPNDPDSNPSRSPELPRRSSSPWRRRAASWLRSTTDALARIVDREPIVGRFAELAARAREPEEVRVELVRLASNLSGAARVELYSDRDGRAAKRLASWPPNFPTETMTEARSAPRGPIACVLSRTTKERPDPLTLQLPLMAGDCPLGTLRLTSSSRRPWPVRLIRQLGTLCAIAATAERGLARPGRGQANPALDPTQGPHDSMILAAFLTFAQAQARRRHEPLSFMEIAVDRLDSIRELLGDELAEAAIERVSRAIKATIRASDVVAKLEGGRIAVLLPNATAENALKVAQSVRSAIDRAGAASTTMPILTASIGLATYPDHAHDVVTLRAAASSTLTRAREQGHGQIALALPILDLQAPGLAHQVG